MAVEHINKHYAYDGEFYYIRISSAMSMLRCSQALFYRKREQEQVVFYKPNDRAAYISTNDIFVINDALVENQRPRHKLEKDIEDFLREHRLQDVEDVSSTRSLHMEESLSTSVDDQQDDRLKELEEWKESVEEELSQKDQTIAEQGSELQKKDKVIQDRDSKIQKYVWEISVYESDLKTTKVKYEEQRSLAGKYKMRSVNLLRWAMIATIVAIILAWMIYGRGG